MTEEGYRRAILGVALATALLALPFLGTLPLFDPDEGYYPAAAAESLAHGHPLDLTLNGEPRWNKPPLAYVLMQGGILLFGRNEFAVRLPSVLEGAALVGILGLLVARMAGGRAGLLAAVVLASSLGFQVMTRAAHPEMGLVLGTAAAQALFALWFVSPAGARPRWAWWAAGLAMGFGFLAKGPSALAMPALMLAAGMLVVPRDGRPSWTEAGRAFGGAALLALVLASPWYLWMGAKHGDAFWSVAFGQMEHLTEARHGGFRGSPFFFVPVLAAAFLPWIAFLPFAFRRLRRSDPSPAARFTLLMALAAGTSFLFWSLSASKNPHYALVFLPPLAAVVGAWQAGLSSEAPTPLPWRATGVGMLALGLLLLAGPSAHKYFDPDALAFRFTPGDANPLTWWDPGLRTPVPLDITLRITQGTLGVLLLVGGLVCRLARNPAARMGILAVVPALAFPAGIALARPLDATLRPFAAIAAAIADEGNPGDPVLVYRARVPSLSFALGREVGWPHSRGEVEAALRGQSRCWFVVHHRHISPDAQEASDGELLLKFHLRFLRSAQSGREMRLWYSSSGLDFEWVTVEGPYHVYRSGALPIEAPTPGSPPPPAPGEAPPATAPPPGGGPR